jgi:hypothetical protein
MKVPLGVGINLVSVYLCNYYFPTIGMQPIIHESLDVLLLSPKTKYWPSGTARI